MSMLSMSPTPMQTPRRLTRRRGSSAATDPFGDYAEQNKSPERKLSSRLTIVRVVPDETSKPSVSDLGEGPSLPAPYPLHTIWTSPSSLERRKTFHTPGPHLGPHRLSFASSSFAEGRTPSPPGPLGPPSPPLSPVLRRRSSISSPYMRSPSLTPQQIVELAQSVKYNAPAPHVPETRPSISPMAVAPATDVEPYVAAEHIEPATFMLVPEGQFLPFVDRPAEVSAFLTTCPTNRLMALLEQAFPLDLRLKRPPGEDTLDPDACPTSFTPSFVTEVQSRAAAPPPSPDAFGDPASWSFGTLLDWMCRVPREQVPDAEWVRAIRTCVLEHSEQICVSLLCALGVPMEGLEDLDTRRPVLEPEPTRLVVSAPTSPPIPRISISGEEYPPQRPGRGRRRSLSADSFSLERERENLEEEDIFSLDISPMVPSPERRDQDILSTPALQRRAETESATTGRSRLSIAMESIGENEAEEEAATKEEAGAPEVPSEVSTEVSTEVGGEALPPSGATTARPTTPVEGEVERIRRELESTPGGRALGLQGLQARVNEGLPIPTDWNGLTIATSPLPAGVPSIPANQLGTPVRLPTISQFAAKRRSSVNVAHVLSGAPGHAGFSWRPGGPLFPVSFASAKEMSEAEMFEAEESRGRERIPSGPRRGRPSLPPRSVRKGYQVPPNSPIEMRKSYRVPPNSPIQYRG